jgi:hypothetical protein
MICLTMLQMNPALVAALPEKIQMTNIQWNLQHLPKFNARV